MYQRRFSRQNNQGYHMTWAACAFKNSLIHRLLQKGFFFLFFWVFVYLFTAQISLCYLHSNRPSLLLVFNWDNWVLQNRFKQRQNKCQLDISPGAISCSKYYPQIRKCTEVTKWVIFQVGYYPQSPDGFDYHTSGNQFKWNPLKSFFDIATVCSAKRK